MPTKLNDLTFTIDAAGYAAGFGKLHFHDFIRNMKEAVDVHTQHETQDEWTKAVAMFALRGLVETLEQDPSGFHWEDLSREYIKSVHNVERRIIARQGMSQVVLANILIGRPK